MKLKVLTTLWLFLLATPAFSQSITVPEKVQVDTPGLIVIRATNLDADDVKWWSVGSGIQTFPPDVVVPKAGVYLGLALQPGTYKVGVVCAKVVNGKAVMSLPQYVVVTVGTPTPPIPPTPPAPTDPLTQALQSAYNKDVDADRAKSLAFLQLAYATMATQASTRTDNTNATFVAWMKSVVEAPGVGLTVNQLRNLRTAVATELQSAWGTNPAPLTAANAAAELTKISNALKGVQ